MEKNEYPNIDNITKNYSPTGLSFIGAKENLRKYGENSFSKQKANGFQMFFKQFINPLTFILLFSATLAFLMGEISDGAIIMTIVILNSVLSFIQEFRSSKAVEKLSGLIKQQVLVVRNNSQFLIDVKKLVPGDVVVLKAGDVVPADVKIIEANNIQVNESQLTGESELIAKCENASLLFSGSIIERGYARCIVYATGDKTELGKIAILSKKARKITPYQKSLSEFSMSMLRMISATIILMLVSKVFVIGFNNFTESLIFAIALAMTVVPEALPMVTTINFSNGALRLAKQKVIVKNLPAVEGLGRINILCTDKTGTLTRNSLTITEIISEDDYLFQKLAYSTIEDFVEGNNKHINAFDLAFIEFIPESIKEETKNWKQLRTFPFDPTKRRRGIVVENPDDNKAYLVVIGAAEILLEISENKEKEKYQNLIAESGKLGIRQLAISYKEIEYDDSFDISDNEADLHFLGYAALIDPLRRTAKTTMNSAKELGIDIKILTGDSLEVATYIGNEVGLLIENERVYTGEELEKMSIPEFSKVVHGNSIFARVTPEQKYRIIEQLKIDNVIGFIGDGVNDTPALHLSDVGIAVHNATDVAKDSADIILVEDNLEVIINGISYGRSIFVNINKYIKHAMIGNLGNFFSLAFFYVVFATKELPMLSVQLLIANIMQELPLMTVYSDSVDEDEISRPQQSSGVKSVVKTSLYLGIFTAVFYLIYMLVVGTEATALTRTNLFLFFNFTQLLIIFSIRSKNFLWKGSKPSKLLLGTISIFIIASIVISYTPPLYNLMGFAPLPFSTFAILTIVAIVYIIMLDMIKVILNGHQS